MSTGIVIGSVAACGIAIMGFSSMYTINEGSIGVITRMGQAVRQENPSGLQFKTPFIMGVEEFDIRERVLTGTLPSATSNQLTTTVEFSANWQPEPSRILEIFQKYGSPEEFATNTIRPRLEQSFKATIGQFTGAQLTREREAVAAAMLDRAKSSLAGYPIIVSSVQMDNFSLPDRYMESVLVKEEQREKTEREQLILEQQNIQAQQNVQTASAERDATKARADGQAYSVTTSAQAEAEATILRSAAEAEAIEARGIAEARAIDAIQQAISDNPLIVEYERTKSWNGTLPVTVMGDQPELLMQLQDIQ